MNWTGGSVKQPPPPEGLFAAAKARSAVVSKAVLEPNREINVSVTGGLVLQTHSAGFQRQGPVNPYAKRPAVPPGTSPPAGSSPPAARPSPAAVAASNNDDDVRGRRDSFASLVADVTGSKVRNLSQNPGAYQVQVLGIEMRKEALESNKEVAMYITSVSKAGQSWTIYRRFQQFDKLHKSLKSKGLLERWDESLPKKLPDPNAMVGPLQQFMDHLIGHPQAGPHYYLSNFLEPLQMGDLKPGQSS